MDWEAEGLLDGLDGADREGRRALLDELHADGVSPEELRRAVGEGRLVLVPVERVLGGEPVYTMRQVAEDVGLPLEWLQESRRALGLPVTAPDEVALTEHDREGARMGRDFRATGLSDEHIFATFRVMGAGLARYADALRGLVAESLLQEGDTERDIAIKVRDWTALALPQLGPALENVAVSHLHNRIRQDALSIEEVRAGRLDRTAQVAIAFADLVGYTALGEEVEAEVLGDVAGRFTMLVTERVAGPVSLVKTIGDGVMLSSPDPAPLVALLLELVDEVEADEGLPPLRGGVHHGPALARLGDWYGGTVNIAARLCARARPGSVLASSDVRALTADDFEWSFAGRKELKGITAPAETWRARKGTDPFLSPR